MRRVAILAIQGGFIEHEQRLRSLGCEVFELRKKADLACPLDALVLPGGESTVQAKLLHELDMFDELRGRIQEGLPTLGTCAGLILLAQGVESASDGRDANGAEGGFEELPDAGFATLPITVRRNGYGRQLGSFLGRIELHEGGQSVQSIDATFIRAPRIVGIGEGVEVIASLEKAPVAVRHGAQIGCTFHPELDGTDCFYRLLLERC